ncbi:MAG: PAS domain S-box protein [Thermoanaerobaculia bacterium]
MAGTAGLKGGATDDALRASEERFRTLIEKAPIAIGMARQGVTLYANPKYLEMYGFESVDEVRGRSIGEQWAPDFRAEIEERARLRATGAPVPSQYEGVGQRKDGTRFPVHAAVTLVQLPDGPCTLAFLTDISERERALEALRGSEERFRTLIEGAPVAIGMSRNGRIVYTNRKYLEMYGHQSVDELRGQPIVEQWAPHSRAQIEESIRRRRLGLPVPSEYEAVGQRKDGSTFSVHAATTLVQLADGVASMAFLTDITQRKRVEEELARSELYYRSLIENALDITAVLSPEGHLRYVSPSAERVLGFKPGDVSGLNVLDLVHPEDRERVADRLRRVLEGGTSFEQFEFRIRHREGFWRTLSVIGKPLPPEMELRGVIINARDLTERQALEAQFRQAQKMEAFGRLAGGVAHDFNNLLTVIQGYGEVLRSSLAKGDPNGTPVEEILKAAERAATLTHQLLAFSRKQILSPRIIRLDAAVAEMEKMLRRLIGEDVELVISLGAALGCIKADPGQIVQVLMNLAVNARDAMPNGGRLTIEVTNADLDEASATKPGHPEPGRYVMLAVRDTGVGMDAEVLSHLFEPFFTTKGPGKGTGLGLATAYGIVKQSGGYIWASSTPGSGTTFRIYMPRVEGEAPASEPARMANPPGRHEVILVVEDEEAVRIMAASALASRSYTVLEAGSAADGLKVAERHPGRIDLLLTDVIMPGMSGRELAERLVALRRGLKVLYMSGYVDDALASHGVLEPGIHLLKKPFTPSSLARVVREVLDEGTSSGFA